MNTRSRCRRNAAFTLVEAAVSIVIVGVMFVAALSTVGAAAQGRRVQAEWRRADSLARALLYEAQQCKYGSTGGSIVPGIVLGVGVRDRSSLTTLDDYSNITDSPPHARDGSSLPDYNGWSRTVSVDRVDPSDPFGAAAGASDKGLKRIVVVVRTPTGALTRLIAFRSRWSPSDLDVAVGQTRAQAAMVHLRLTGGTELFSGVILPNGPQLVQPTIIPVAVEPDVSGGADDLGSKGLVTGLLRGLLGRGK